MFHYYCSTANKYLNQARWKEKKYPQQTGLPPRISVIFFILSLRISLLLSHLGIPNDTHRNE